MPVYNQNRSALSCC